MKMFQKSPMITHVIYRGSEAPPTRHLLCAGTVCYPTTARSLLSATASSSSIPTTATDLPIPAPASRLQSDAASSGLLLPTANGQGPVRPRRNCGTTWLTEVRVCARSLLAFPCSTFSFQVRSEKEVLSNASAPSYPEGIVHAE